MNPSNETNYKELQIVTLASRVKLINKMFGTRIFKMSSTVSPYRCEACGSSFNSLQELEQHKRQEHQK
ncbi:MAG TPA: C2H2-type zinc finger protein [Candidatus Acidoferrum sp.]|nr:C2H2-type zinc finger protein [Candidatus Acidoferrum sp.]